MSSLTECSSLVDNHLMIDCTLNYKNQEISLPALMDTGASDVTFIDQTFVHQHNYPLILLPISRTLKVVDGWPAAFRDITHYVQLNFSVGSHSKKKFKLLVTQLSHCPVILEYPWLWQHWVHLDFDLHTLMFAHEGCKPHCSNFPVSVSWKDIEFKPCFWEPLPWKDIKSEFCPWEPLPRKDVKTEFCHSVSVLENSQVQTCEFAFLLRKNVEIESCHWEPKPCPQEPQPCHHELKSCHWKPELCCWESTSENSRVQTHEFTSVSSIVKSQALEICMIGSASFAWVVQKKNHEVFAISMKDIEKALCYNQGSEQSYCAQAQGAGNSCTRAGHTWWKACDSTTGTTGVPSVLGTTCMMGVPSVLGTMSVMSVQSAQSTRSMTGVLSVQLRFPTI